MTIPNKPVANNEYLSVQRYKKSSIIVQNDKEIISYIYNKV